MSESTQPHEAFKVDAELEKEFEKALSYQLTDEDIERARLLLGHSTATRIRELNCEATHDSLRNWAQGVGDDNPLYTDEDYGRDTRWGSQIGHGTQLGHLKSPMLGDPIPAEIAKQTKSLFRGVHVFVSGGTWDWYRPLRPGDRIMAFSGAESLDVRNPGGASGHETDKMNAHTPVGTRHLAKGINPNDGAESARRFLEEFGVTYPNYLDDGDQTAAAKVALMPSTFFLAPDGTVVARESGELTADELAGYLDLLRESGN